MGSSSDGPRINTISQVEYSEDELSLGINKIRFHNIKQQLHYLELEMFIPDQFTRIPNLKKRIYS